MTVTVFCPLDKHIIEHELLEIIMFSWLQYNCVITEEDGYFTIHSENNSEINEILWFIKTKLYVLNFV